MQEHLIPQDISNYKFHLIGELDLKQFGEVMAGVIIAVIINAMSWPSIISWPLMILSVGVGLIAAFVPLGGQPLSHWLTVFVKALFSPTKFYWRKQTVIPSYFTYELPARNREFLDANSTFNDSPARKHKALAYFSTLSSSLADQDDPLERFNDANIAKATQDFTYAPEPEVDNVVAPKKLISKPQVGTEQSVRQRQIVTPTQETLNSFLETSSIFQPTQILEGITAVDAKMANSDSTLAAALDNNTTTPDVIPPVSTQTSVSTTPDLPPAINTTTPNLTTPDQLPNKSTASPLIVTSPGADISQEVAPSTTQSAPIPPISGVTSPSAPEIILPTLSTPLESTTTSTSQQTTTTLIENNNYLNSDITLPDLNVSANTTMVAPDPSPNIAASTTPAVDSLTRETSSIPATSPVSPTTTISPTTQSTIPTTPDIVTTPTSAPAQQVVFELPNTPILTPTPSTPPNPPLIISQ